MISELDDKNFKSQVIDSKIPVMVDFYASWCVPCKVLEPHIEKLVKSFGSKIKIFKMNVEKSPQTPSTFSIMSVPNILFFNGGKIIEQFSNGIDIKELENKIKSLTE